MWKLRKNNTVLVVIRGSQRYQILAHTAVQTNDSHLLISAWKSFIPIYFAMNKVNYARFVYIASFLHQFLITHSLLNKTACGEERSSYI